MSGFSCRGLGTVKRAVDDVSWHGRRGGGPGRRSAWLALRRASCWLWWLGLLAVWAGEKFGGGWLKRAMSWCTDPDLGIRTRHTCPGVLVVSRWSCWAKALSFAANDGHHFFSCKRCCGTPLRVWIPSEHCGLGSGDAFCRSPFCVIFR